MLANFGGDYNKVSLLPLLLGRRVDEEDRLRRRTVGSKPSSLLPMDGLRRSTSQMGSIING